MANPVVRKFNFETIDELETMMFLFVYLMIFTTKIIKFNPFLFLFSTLIIP